VNLQTLEKFEPKKLESGIRCLCFVPSGQLFVGLDNGSVVSLSVRGAQLLSSKISRKPIRSLLWSGAYGLFVAAEDRHLRLLAPSTLEEIAISEKLRWVSHDLALIDQDQQLVAAGSDNNLHLIDPQLLAPLLVIHAGTARQTRNSSGHGQLVTAGQDGTVTILDAGTHSRRSVLPIANGELAGVQIADAEPALFLADQQGVVQEWDLQTLEPLSAVQVDGSTKALTVSGSGDVLAVCTDR
jgi:WD40 repeat protein